MRLLACYVASVKRGSLEADTRSEAAERRRPARELVLATPWHEELPTVALEHVDR
jgi:hypothetical protein